MGLLGIISGTISVQDKGIFKNLEKRDVETEFGNAHILCSDTIAFIPRHGKDPKHHILPHQINHPANMKALSDMGIKEVISINSTGSLKKDIQPGTIVVPDDFIVFSGLITAINSKTSHMAPKLGHGLRRRCIDAASDCGIHVVESGTYWQTTGPRFETKAEIRLMSQFADLVGMTMASEAIIAQECGLSYAALCSVDNYGHGLIEQELTLDEITGNARRNTDLIISIITRYIERMRD